MSTIQVNWVELQQKCTSLGQTFETLGSSSGYYLQFDASGGLSIARLDCVDLFLRCIFAAFGAYSSTYLSTIVEKLSDCPDVPPALFAKMVACWQKTYPQQSCPLKMLINSTCVSLPEERGSPDVLAVSLSPVEQGISGFSQPDPSAVLEGCAASNQLGADPRISPLEGLSPPFSNVGDGGLVSGDSSLGVESEEVSGQLRPLEKNPIYDGPAAEEDEYAIILGLQETWGNLTAEGQALEICWEIDTEMRKTPEKTVTSCLLARQALFAAVVNALIDKGYKVSERLEFDEDLKRIGSSLVIKWPGELESLYPALILQPSLGIDDEELVPECVLESTPLLDRPLYQRSHVAQHIWAPMEVAEDRRDNGQQEGVKGYYQLRSLNPNPMLSTNPNPIYTGPVKLEDDYQPLLGSTWANAPLGVQVFEICNHIGAYIRRRQVRVVTSLLLTRQDLFSAVVNALLKKGYHVEEELEFDLEKKRIGSRLRIEWRGAFEDFYTESGLPTTNTVLTAFIMERGKLSCGGLLST